MLSQVDRTTAWRMHSLRVDEVWHQFVLFTVEYVTFCKRYFGRYVHHSPSNAPVPESAVRRPAATPAEFAGPVPGALRRGPAAALGRTHRRPAAPAGAERRAGRSGW